MIPPAQRYAAAGALLEVEWIDEKDPDLDLIAGRVAQAATTGRVGPVVAALVAAQLAADTSAETWAVARQVLDAVTAAAPVATGARA